MYEFLRQTGKQRPSLERERGGSLSGLSKMKRLELMAWMRNNPTFKRATNPRWDITKSFTRQLIERRDSKIPQNNILEIIGQTGSGKSESAIALCEQFIKKNGRKLFISFSSQEFIGMAKRMKPGDCLLKDEQAKRVGQGSIREKLAELNLEEITRKSQRNFVFASPTMRLHGAIHYRLYTLMMDIENKCNRLAVIHPATNTCLGWMVVHILDPNPYRAAYDARKDEYIEEVVTGRLKNNALVRIAQGFVDDERFNSSKNKKRKLAFVRLKNPYLTTGELNDIVEYVDMLRDGTINADDDEEVEGDG